MTKKVVLVSLLFSAACTAPSAGGGTGAALSASAEVQAFGIAAYRVSAEGAELLDAKGAAIGSLWVSAPTTDTRAVAIDLDGNEWLDEIERPRQGGFVVPTGLEREGRIQADPALAPLFAHFDIQFRSTENETPADGLTPSDALNCSDIPFVAGCTAAPTCYNSSSTKTITWTSDYSLDCVATCSPDAYLGPSTCNSADGTCRCKCGYWTYKTDRNASCQTLHGCTAPNGYDIVTKRRTCFDPGSCSNTALGFQYCGPSY